MQCHDDFLWYYTFQWWKLYIKSDHVFWHCLFILIIFQIHPWVLPWRSTREISMVHSVRHRQRITGTSSFYQLLPGIPEKPTYNHHGWALQNCEKRLLWKQLLPTPVGVTLLQWRRAFWTYIFDLAWTFRFRLWRRCNAALVVRDSNGGRGQKDEKASEL